MRTKSLQAGLLASAEQLYSLVDNGSGISTSEHLAHDCLCLVSLLDGKESSRHGFVRAGLAFLAGHGVVDGLSLLNLPLGSPAVNQRVGNVGSELHLPAPHLCQHRLGLGNAVVGHHGLEKGLVNVGVDRDQALLHDGIKHLSRACHVVQDAAPGVDERGIVHRLGSLTGRAHLFQHLLGGLHVHRLKGSVGVDEKLGVDNGAVCNRGGLDAERPHLGEVEEAVVDAASLAQLADQGVVEERARLNALGLGAEEDADGLRGLVERLCGFLQCGDVQPKGVCGRRRAHLQQLLVVPLGLSAIAQGQASTDHGVQDGGPTVADDGVVGHRGHVAASHGDNVPAEVHLALAGGGGDELRIRNVPGVSPGASHVPESVEGLAEARALAAVDALQIIGDQGGALEVGAVGVRVVAILVARDRWRGQERGNALGLRRDRRHLRGQLAGIDDAARLHVASNEIGTFVNLLAELEARVGPGGPDSLEHHLRPRQALRDLAGANEGNRIHGGRLDEGGGGVHLGVGKDVPVPGSRGDVAQSHAHGKESNRRRSEILQAGGVDVGVGLNGRGGVVAVGGDGGDFHHDLVPDAGIKGPGPLERLSEDAPGDEAPDEAEVDQGILHFGDGDAVFVHNLLEEPHRALDLVGDDVGIDDGGVHLGVQSAAERGAPGILRNGQAAVLVVALDGADEIAGLGVSGDHGGEDVGGGDDVAEFHVLIESQHVRHAAKLGARRDQLPVRLGRVRGLASIEGHVKQLDSQVEALVLAQDGAFQLDVESLAVGRHPPAHHVGVHVQSLGDDLGPPAGDVNRGQQKGVVGAGDGPDARGQHGLEHGRDLGIPGSLGQLLQMIGIGLGLDLDGWGGVDATGGLRCFDRRHGCGCARTRVRGGGGDCSGGCFFGNRLELPRLELLFERSVDVRKSRLLLRRDEMLRFHSIAGGRGVGIGIGIGLGTQLSDGGRGIFTGLDHALAGEN
ncbi:hypothetical protein Trco_003818 [Trichoderma cornu-damae]|uniref:Uncharacterized protein n=1 Tax=Trichoderma cornu-damae TaxID=654480 RepID=A0A9P8QJH8_9HYPO|nr:hypothetical protein Trco_003818 [Trichoderma cornu-damae]